MSTVAVPTSRRPIVYPESDGKPMAENTLQYRWVVKITGELEHLFADDPNVFVAGDLFWYPVEGRPDICSHGFARRVRPPQGRPRSYRQWEEGGIAPQVVFEVLSPGTASARCPRSSTSTSGMALRSTTCTIPTRSPGAVGIRPPTRRTRRDHANARTLSPRLKVRFEMNEDGLRLIRPDGKPFVTFGELAVQVEQERSGRDGTCTGRRIIGPKTCSGRRRWPNSRSFGNGCGRPNGAANSTTHPNRGDDDDEQFKGRTRTDEHAQRPSVL